MSKVTTIGLDIAKHVFHAHGADERGVMIFSRKLKRGKLLDFFADQPACVVALDLRRRLAGQRRGIVAGGKPGGQRGIPLNGEARQQDHRQRCPPDQREDQRPRCRDQPACGLRPDQHSAPPIPPGAAR